MNIHKLLKKQIQKYLPKTLQDQPQVKQLLAAVNESYIASQRDLELAGHVFTITEEEYMTLNARLKHEIAVRNQSVQKLKETIGLITGEDQAEESDDLLIIARYLNQQVTERRTTEDRLRASRELWHFALEGTGDGICEFDPNTKEMFFSPRYKTILGYENHEMKSNKWEWIRRIHEDDRNGVLQTGKDYIAGKITSHQREYRLRHKNGKYIWILDRGRKFISAGTASVEKIISTHTDITERKQKEEEYKRISLVASANENGVVFTDASGRITWANEGFVRLTGYPQAAILGQTPFDLCRGPQSDRTVMREMLENFQSGRSFHSELIHYRYDGTWFWGRAKGQAILNEAGQVSQYFAIIEDISKEKEAQQELREYEQRLKIALSNVGDSYWERHLPSGKVFFSNLDNGMLGHFADAQTDVAGLWLDAVYPDDRKLVEQINADYEAGTIAQHTIDYRMTHKDGSIRWIMDRGMVTERSTEGKPLKIIGTHIDITRQKELEQELSQRVQQFKSLSENIPGVLYEYEFREDGTGHLRYVSPAVEKVLGISEADFRNYNRFLHPNDREEISKKLRHSRAMLDPFHHESKISIPGKGIIWHSMTASFSYYTPEGAAVFTGLMLDITERMNTEQALRINEEKYRNIIANMNLGLLEVDNDDVIQFANSSFCDMSGYTLQELTSKKAAQLFMKGDNLDLMTSKRENRKNGISDVYEMAVENGKAEKKWWLISGAPRYNDKGELVGSIGIHLDITQQKLLELELLEAREIAVSSSNAKQLFLANMSHEIRTPMNAILGMSRQLQKMELNQQQELYVNTINNAGEHLMVIINDILDISKIDAGKLSLETIQFSLYDVVGNIVEIMNHRASEKGLIMESTIDPGVARSILGDPFRLKQILFNLTSNAVKFSEKGTVKISCSVLEQQGNTQFIKIIVADNGIGMDKEYMSSIFQSFSQEDRSVTRKFGGTGLGMTITRQLSEMMGGRIEVFSEKNVGTTISVILPFLVDENNGAQSPQAIMADVSILEGKRILLVEDNEMNRLVANLALRNYGVEIIEVYNGVEAVERVKTDSFDLILMDMQMPVMDGIEATKIMRREKYTDAPIIALTANAIKGESEKCLDVGMNDFVSKPFEEEGLVATISKWLFNAAKRVA